MTGRARPIPTASRVTVARMTIRARLTKTVDLAGRSAEAPPTMAPNRTHTASDRFEGLPDRCSGTSRDQQSVVLEQLARVLDPGPGGGPRELDHEAGDVVAGEPRAEGARQGRGDEPERPLRGQLSHEQ